MQHWVWVTGPDYYLDEDGNEHPELDPDSGYATDSWWTCHSDTRAGDLVVLYRSTDAKDIAYLLRTTSDAYSLGNDPSSEWSGYHGCDFEVVRRFPRPVPIAELKADPVVATWPALRAAFVKSAWRVPDEVWERLMEMASVTPLEIADSIQASRQGVALEIDIERELMQRPELLHALGLDFRYLERQVWCPPSGRADLVGYGTRSSPRIVVELKRGRAGSPAVVQVLDYRRTLATQSSRPVVAVLIADGIDARGSRHLADQRHAVFVPLDDLDLGCRRDVRTGTSRR